MIDTHTHLNTDSFNDDVDLVIKRALNAGVKHILVIGMDQKANLKGIGLSQKYPMLHATVGIHPGSLEDENIEHVRKLVNQHDVVAIGECGLDFYWNQDNKDQQLMIFQQQIELAVQTKLPLIIHTRNSFKEAYDMLLPYKGQVTGVFHCFSSTLEDANKAIDLGFMIGLDGPVTYKNNQELKRIIEHVDLSHLLVETDSPYLAPVPFRGKRNEPSYLKYIVDQIAKIKGMPIEKIEQQTTKNAIHLFKLGGHNI
jgi:TatD DNase family protein